MFLRILLFYLLVGGEVTIEEVGPQASGMARGRSAGVGVCCLAGDKEHTRVGTAVNSCRFSTFCDQRDRRARRCPGSHYKEQDRRAAKDDGEEGRGSDFRFRFYVLVLPFGQVQICSGRPVCRVQIDGGNGASRVNGGCR